MQFNRTFPETRWVVALAVVAFAALALSACEDDDDGPTGGGPLPSTLVDPVWEYGRSEGQAVVGGYVYRGADINPLRGRYVYGDNLSRHVWALTYNGATASNVLLFDAPERVSAFGVAEDDELFVVGYNDTIATKIRGITEVGGVYSPTDPFPNLTFDQPVDLRNAGDGSDRLFVVEQNGLIKVFENESTVDTVTTFLDLTSQVACCGELGLLGLVFHPDYESNGYFFVYYSAPGGSPYRDILARYQVSADPNVADPSSERIMIELNDREDNHQGGGLFFGEDGFLYVAIGDEGGVGDPFDNAQNLNILFGKVLRLDVDQNVDTEPYYGIPPLNPFASGTSGNRREIYAWGFRNPWRISYDSQSNRLWVADVGQDLYEEINVVGINSNYGWDCREGAHPYTGDPSPACDQ